MAKIAAVVLASACGGFTLAGASLPLIVSACATQEEVKIQLSDLPEAVRAAAGRVYPDLEGASAERERDQGHVLYEISREVDGYDLTVTFAEDGQVLEVEREIPPAQLAPGARAAIEQRWPGAELTRIETVEERSFEAKFRWRGRAHEVKLQATGVVLESEEGGKVEGD